MFDLSEKCALITGASGGIGGAIARAFHASGARVGLSGTRVDALEALAKDLGDGAYPLPADLSSSEATEGLIKDAEAAAERLGLAFEHRRTGYGELGRFMAEAAQGKDTDGRADDRLLA